MASAWTARSLVPTLFSSNLSSQGVAPRNAPNTTTGAISDPAQGNASGTAGPVQGGSPGMGGGPSASGITNPTNLTSGLGSNNFLQSALLAAILGGGQQQQSTTAENINALANASNLATRNMVMQNPMNLLTGMYQTGVGGQQVSGGVGADNNLFALSTRLSREMPSMFDPTGASFGRMAIGPNATQDYMNYNLLSQMVLNNAPGAVAPSALSSASANAAAPSAGPGGPAGARPQPQVANVWGGNRAMSGWGLPPVLG